MTVRERLKAYHAETAPLIDHYEGCGVLRRIEAMGSIDDIRGSLAAIVGAVSV